MKAIEDEIKISENCKNPVMVELSLEWEEWEIRFDVIYMQLCVTLIEDLLVAFKPCSSFDHRQPYTSGLT